MKAFWQQSDLGRLVILAPLVALFALGLDFYIPIVPLLKDLHQVSEEAMQLTLSGYMLMCAVAQIMTGPLCDRYGRRPVAMVSLGVFIVGSMLAAAIPSFKMLLIARILQAAGASGTFLCAYTTIRDLYSASDDSARMYSYINVCISQAPIFAPTIGGFLAQQYGWPVVFVVLMMIGFYTLLVSYNYYGETVPHRHQVEYTHLKSAYYQVVLNRNYQVYSLAAATGMGSFFMFFSQSPYIVMEYLGYSKPEFGVMFGMVGFSFFMASFLTSLICQRVGVHKTVELGSFFMSLGGIALMLMQHLYGITAVGFILPMMMVVSGAALVIGAGLAGTMQPFGHIAGVAFSAVGFVKFAFSALLGMVLMRLPITPMMLGSMISTSAMTSLLLCIMFRHQLVHHVAKEALVVPTID
jgi:Bcr/CflA subfamily drug resistance transporter